jgi:predicted DNA-binding protein
MAKKSPNSQRIVVELSPELEARLAAHCAAWGEPAADVVADAIALHLDELEGAAVEADGLEAVAQLAGSVS